MCGWVHISQTRGGSLQVCACVGHSLFSDCFENIATTRCDRNSNATQRAILCTLSVQTHLFHWDCAVYKLSYLLSFGLRRFCTVYGMPRNVKRRRSKKYANPSQQTSIAVSVGTPCKTHARMHIQACLFPTINL